MQDAVILANCLYDFEDSTPASITAAFQDYRDQRYPRARAMSANSRFISTVMAGQVRLLFIFHFLAWHYSRIYFITIKAYPNMILVVFTSFFFPNRTLQDWWERLLRNVLFYYVPDWLQQWVYGKMTEYRPQITWLPLVENRGTGYVIPQKPSRRYTEEQTQKRTECH